ncbi:hypothetical protein ACMD2_08945 [Ananas comosus]|uniref:Uncharacterized protein n=1 Tax=Ananas comosus TaxID=4615 RepID=A0A199V314_ANACO|nr:hypothetical protein ACMD2_08945 [Ananas comosus]
MSGAAAKSRPVSGLPVPSEKSVSSLQIMWGPQSRRLSGSAHRWLMTMSATDLTPLSLNAEISDFRSSWLPYFDEFRSYNLPGM